MKVLLSGGWGYGNLGDDAILVATVKLLRQEYPHASITVMTYDCDAMPCDLGDRDVHVVPSIHRHLIGNLSLRRFRPLCNGTSLPNPVRATFGQRIRSKLRSKVDKRYISLAEGISYRKYRWLLRNPGALPASDEFRLADLFVMSGGAYLNSRWPDSVYAHALELRAAHQCGVKSVLVGQSIGPFLKQKVRTVAFQAIRLASQISVRDDPSYDELQHGGIDCYLSPDIALAEIDFDFDTLPELTIVASSGLGREAQEHVRRAAGRISHDHNLAIKVLVTRRWWSDVRRAQSFCDMLRTDSIETRLVIPTDHVMLQQEIGVSRAVLSPNLHGLILGWRAGVPCVSLHGHGKYLAFMQQTHQEKRALVHSQTSVAELVSTIDDALQTSRRFKRERQAISSETALNFYRTLAV